MEEFIGFGLVALFITSLVLIIKKVFTKKKDLYEYEDEIMLDNDMVHYGPFSGSSDKSYRKHILLLAVSSSFLNADIELRTIDNWGINSWGQEALILQKSSDNHQSNFYIEMNRPFCICTDPVITTPSGTSNYNIGDRIEAVITVDNFKPKKIVFDVKNIFDDGTYLLKPKYYPSLRYAEIIKIKFAQNVSLDDMLFNTKGMSNAMKQSERICFSDYQLKESEIEDVRI
tara:strand:+ start:1729 stop:2415 length:687 start_codon:yes stop_codon:yes gene_type:complete